MIMSHSNEANEPLLKSTTISAKRRKQQTSADKGANDSNHIAANMGQISDVLDCAAFQSKFNELKITKKLNVPINPVKVDLEKLYDKWISMINPDCDDLLRVSVELKNRNCSVKNSFHHESDDKRIVVRELQSQLDDIFGAEEVLKNIQHHDGFFWSDVRVFVPVYACGGLELHVFFWTYTKFPYRKYLIDCQCLVIR